MKNEAALVKACLDGDTQAFSVLYCHFASRMLVVCTRYATNREEAKDLLQEGFIRVYNQLHTFRGEGSLEGWIRRIMVNTALEAYRKQARERENKSVLYEDSEDSPPLASDDILAHLAFEELLEMIQQLTPAYRMVFNLYVFEGLKHQEIAEKLGISEGTSKSNLADARRLLKLRIEKVALGVK